MNKRLLAGLAAAGIIGGGVYGFAASLDPTSDAVGAGTSVVASCDSAVNVDYTVQWGTTSYELKNVVVSGIDATASKCLGDDIAVTLMEGTTAKSATSQSVASGTETFDVSSLHVSARSLSDVHVVISS